MSFIVYVKEHLTRLPYKVGKVVSLVPYAYRPGIGSVYRTRRAERDALDDSSALQKQRFVFERVKRLVEHAYANVPFYHDLYRTVGVEPSDLQGFDDLLKLPIVKRAELQDVPLEYRSAARRGRYLVNTGGSSGQPLAFYVEPSCVGHEWAHMHGIWAKLGFKQGDLTIVFGGRSDVDGVLEYDSARHRLAVDLYSGWRSVADRLHTVFDRYRPRYLHGYPSSIFDFVIWLEVNQHPLLPVLRRHLKGMFLGSELPSSSVRKEVEASLGCGSVSWYGHTERSVLAYEKDGYGSYSPFLSYGFAEAIGVRGSSRLISTGYYNYASPLIRYDTGDLVDPHVEDGILDHFRVSDGREGEFILDELHNKVFLTGLVFGRHHRLFEEARHIQIYQRQPGKAEVLIVPRRTLTSSVAASLFDGSNVLIEFDFRIVESPRRSAAGKVPLLVRDLNG